MSVAGDAEVVVAAAADDDDKEVIKLAGTPPVTVATRMDLRCRDGIAKERNGSFVFGCIRIGFSCSLS